MPTVKLGSRFISKVLIDLNTGCWNWTASIDKGGYGRFRIAGEWGFAHRYANQTPENMHTDHLCRNRCCVNPDHLETVTNIENVNRGLTGKINHRNSKKTHCTQGHEYTEENTIVTVEGWRRCRTCYLKWNKRSCRRSREHEYG